MATLSSIWGILVLYVIMSHTKAAALVDLLPNHKEATNKDDEATTEDTIPLFAESAHKYLDDATGVFDFETEHEIDDYMHVQDIVSPNELRNPLVNQHKYSYLLNNENKCKGSVFVLALIKSTPESFVERQDVRDTWGSVKSYKDSSIVPVFIMGRNKETDKVNKVEEEILKESIKHGDIVQGDFIDHFKNQTYKSVMGLAWAGQYCNKADFVLVTNDNTMVDVYHLVDFLKDKSANGDSANLLYCSAFFDIGPVRDPNDNLFVTINDYPYKMFPPHCEGFAYVLSGDVRKRLLEATKSVPFLWLDDVYVTGLLASKAKVKHMDMVNEHTYNLMQQEHLNTDISKSMFLLAPFKELRKNWANAWTAISKQKQ